MAVHSPVFSTERLTARRWSLDDADVAYAMYSRPEVTRYLGAEGRPMPSLEQQREALARIVAGYDAQPGLGSWAIEVRTTGDVVGAVLLKPLPAATEIEVGWHLAPEHWGNGYATEAATAALRHGFGTLGLTEIYAVVRPENERSLRVARRLGMTSLGRTDRYYGVEAELFRIGRDEVPVDAPAAASIGGGT